MRQVKVESALYTVNSGSVGLTGKQAEARLHNLRAVRVDKKTGDGQYEVVNPIQFKQGETFGYSGNIGKNGQLRDPGAEERQRVEQAESTAQAVEAAVKAERERVRVAFDKAVAEAKGELEEKLRPEIEARVRAELEPKIRAELMKELGKPGQQA